MTGASPFPRHWIYDGVGQLARKSGITDFKNWILRSFGTEHSPWGDEDSPQLVTAVETALERALSVQLMHGVQQPAFATLKAGDTLVRQGDAGSDLFLVLDGVIRVDRDGEQLAEYGPGAILGEPIAPGGRDPHVYAGGGDAVQGSVGAGRSVRPRRAHRAGQRTPE